MQAWPATTRSRTAGRRSAAHCDRTRSWCCVSIRVRRPRRSCRSREISGCRSPAPASSSRINSAIETKDPNQGPKRLIQTIEQDFQVPIDHYLQVDFAGFKGIVRAVGGLPVYFPTPVRDKNSGLSVPVAGCTTLDDSQALGFVRSRHYEIYVERQVAGGPGERSRSHQPPAGLHPAGHPLGPSARASAIPSSSRACWTSA